VERTDARTLLVTPEHGYPFVLLRDAAHAFQVGDRVELSGVTVEVREIGEDRFPAQVAFVFEVPLEDASLLWLALRGDRYHPVEPPQVGENVVWYTDDPVRAGIAYLLKLGKGFLVDRTWFTG
jgi:hypothetical protein